MITSDHSGFAGVQSPQIQPPPANIPSSELTASSAAVSCSSAGGEIPQDDYLDPSGWEYIASQTSANIPRGLTVSRRPTFETNTKAGFLWPHIYALTRYPRCI